MKITFLPKTRSGKWSVALFTAFIIFTIAGSAISALQKNTIEYPNPINSPLLGTVIYLTFSASIMASITGLIAIRNNNERSIWFISPFPLA